MGATRKIIELIGLSEHSWEDATKIAVETAAKTLPDLKVESIEKFNVVIENGKVLTYKVGVNVSFEVVV